MFTGEGNDRPSVNPGVPVYSATWGSSLQYLDSAAFNQNATGTFGNLGRNVIRYPGVINVDTTLSRVFQITERLQREARAEAFNVVNHTNFSAYSGAYSGLTPSFGLSTFGQITSAAIRASGNSR